MLAQSYYISSSKNIMVFLSLLICVNLGCFLFPAGFDDNQVRGVYGKCFKTHREARPGATPFIDHH